MIDTYFFWFFILIVSALNLSEATIYYEPFYVEMEKPLEFVSLITLWWVFVDIPRILIGILYF
jgi:hypothetical protein